MYYMCKSLKPKQETQTAAPQSHTVMTDRKTDKFTLSEKPLIQIRKAKTEANKEDYFPFYTFRHSWYPAGLDLWRQVRSSEEFPHFTLGKN